MQRGTSKCIKTFLSVQLCVIKAAGRSPTASHFRQPGVLKTSCEVLGSIPGPGHTTDDENETDGLPGLALCTKDWTHHSLRGREKSEKALRFVSQVNHLPPLVQSALHHVSVSASRTKTCCCRFGSCCCCCFFRVWGSRQDHFTSLTPLW